MKVKELIKILNECDQDLDLMELSISDKRCTPTKETHVTTNAKVFVPKTQESGKIDWRRRFIRYSSLDRESAQVILCGKLVWFDIWNTKLESTKNGLSEGKRRLTEDEMFFISKLPNKWDAERRGHIVTFDGPCDGLVDIFFPASSPFSSVRLLKDIE